MKRLAWLLLFLACNSTRDDADVAQEHALDLVLAEREDLEAHRALRQTEQDELNRVRSAFQPVTSAELLALAGPDARIVRDTAEGFYDVVSLSGTGPRSVAFGFARAALARSRSVNLTELKPKESTWIVTLTVITPFVPMKPTKVSGFTPSADTSWCYSTCRVRQKRIVEKNARLTALEAALGGLVTLPKDRKLLHDLLEIDSKFIGEEVGSLLDQLESAPWLPADAEVSFSPAEVRLTTPPEAAPGCSTTFSSCVYDDAHHALVIKPALAGAP